MTLAPVDQRDAALALANHVRCERARLKREVHAGNLSITALLRDPPDELLTAQVIELLKAVRRVGDYRAKKMCKEASINPRALIGDLTDYQRERLSEVVGRTLEKARRRRDA